MRRSIQPFVSGDTFRSVCDHILDETGVFDLGKVKMNDRIFVKTDLIRDFFHTSKNINKPFILITHNSDHETTFLTPEEIDDLTKRCKWFAQNNRSTKVNSIPIGLANAMWAHGNPEKIFSYLPKHEGELEKLFRTERKNQVLVSMSPNTNAIRGKIVTDLAEKGLTNRLGLSWDEYIHELKNSSFCVCPEGNGIDTHRLWETLYCGCIPIMVQNDMSQMLNDLPVLYVKSWEDITPEYMEINLSKIKSGKYNFAKLFFPYWEKLISTACCN